VLSAQFKTEKKLKRRLAELQSELELDLLKPSERCAQIQEFATTKPDTLRDGSLENPFTKANGGGCQLL